MCLILDTDLYKAISDGRVDVVTDHIDHIDANGHRAEVRSSPRRRRDRHRNRPAAAGAGWRRDQHRRRARSSRRTGSSTRSTCSKTSRTWRGASATSTHSWTLRADLTARAVAKLLAYMDSHGYTHAYPHLGDIPMPEKPAWNMQRGLRAARRACAAEVRHAPAVERAAQLRARRHRPSLRPHRGVDGVRPCGYGVRRASPVPSNCVADNPNVVLKRSARCDGLAKPAFIAAVVRLSPAAMAVPA